MTFPTKIDWSTWVPWVFSGIGVSVLGWFGRWFFKLYKRYENAEQVRNIPKDRWEAELVPVAPVQSQSSSSQVNISGSHVEGPVAGRDVNIGTYTQKNSTPEAKNHHEYSETPTPNDIDAAIRKVSLFLQDSVAQSYIGIKVRWKSKLRKLIPRENKDEIAVQFRGTHESSTIHTIVRLDEYPILKTVRGKEEVEITGTIERIEAGIYLKDVKLRFLPLRKREEWKKEVDDIHKKIKEGLGGDKTLELAKRLVELYDEALND